jgi:hypothetical protein
MQRPSVLRRRMLLCSVGAALLLAVAASAQAMQAETRRDAWQDVLAAPELPALTRRNLQKAKLSQRFFCK